DERGRVAIGPRCAAATEGAATVGLQEREIPGRYRGRRIVEGHRKRPRLERAGLRILLGRGHLICAAEKAVLHLHALPNTARTLVRMRRGRSSECGADALPNAARTFMVR